MIATDTTETLTRPGFSASRRHLHTARRCRAHPACRATPGSFALIVDGQHSDPALRDILRGGDFSLTLSEPDDARLRTSLLKSAYLAACLVLGTIPDSDDARSVRSELLGAISDSSALASGPGPFAASLVKLRLYDEPPHPLYRATMHRDDTVAYGFGLGRFGFVSWPMPDLLESARLFYAARTQP